MSQSGRAMRDVTSYVSTAHFMVLVESGGENFRGGAARQLLVRRHAAFQAAWPGPAHESRIRPDHQKAAR